MSATLKALRDIKEAFIAVCKRHRGRVEDTTCFISPRDLYYAIDDLAREVKLGEVQPRFTRLRFVAKSVVPGRTQTINIVLLPFGRDKVKVDATVSSEIHDRLSRWFHKESFRAEENIRAEGSYHVELDNEFYTRSWGSREATWSNLGDEVYKLISELQIEGSKTAAVEAEAWKWFKKKVEKSEDWWELTRK